MNDLRMRFDTDAAGISYALSIASIGGIFGALASTLLDRLQLWRHFIPRKCSNINLWRHRFAQHFDVIFGSIIFVLGLSVTFRVSTTQIWFFTFTSFIEEFLWTMANPGTNIPFTVTALARALSRVRFLFVRFETTLPHFIIGSCQK